MFREELRSSLRFPLFLTRIGAMFVIVFAIGAGVLWVGGDSVIRRVERTRLTTQEVSPTAGQDTFYRSRGWIWRDTLQMIRANWMTGVGRGAFQTAYPIYSERDGTLQVGQAHNDYLQIVAECGVVGAAAVIGFIYLVMREILRAIRRRDPLLSGLALGAGGGIFAMLVHSLFDFNLQLPSNALLFLTLTAVVSIISRAPALEKESDVYFGSAVRVRGVTREMEVWS
jgi:O-antigen ligase